jgi:predicted Na+-dependent transporter
MVVTVGYMPLVLPRLLNGVSVDATQIARSLVLLMLLPLALGLAAKAHHEVTAERVRPLLDRTSTASLILLTVLILTVNVNNLIALFGTRGVLASVLFLSVGACSSAELQEGIFHHLARWRSQYPPGGFSPRWWCRLPYETGTGSHLRNCITCCWDTVRGVSASTG